MKPLEFDKLAEETFKDFRRSLKNDYQIELRNDSLVNDPLSPEFLKRMMETPTEFYLNEEGELCVTIDGEVRVLDPKIKDKVIMDGQKDALIEKIPACPFDTFCGGVRRKQNEVVAAYKIVIVNKLLKGVYDNRINNLISTYDFTKCASISNDGMTFCDLLKIIQENATPVVKLVLTCCSIIISNTREKNAPAYIGILSPEDTESLSNLVKKIALLEAESSEAVRALPEKFDRLQKIKDKDKAKEKILEATPIRLRVLYRISKLSSDVIPSNERSNIKECARVLCDKMLKDGTLVSSDYYGKLVERISRKAIKERLYTIKLLKFGLCMKDDVDLSNVLPKL
jgi:hypothetical protein